MMRLKRSLGFRLERAGTALQRRALVDLLRSLGVENASGIRTFTTPSELQALYKLASQTERGSPVVEIGSYLGASTCFLAAGLVEKGSSIYCVDTWNNETMPEGERDTFSEFLENTKAFRSIVVPVRKQSAALVEGDLPQRIGLAFIDGDHSYPAVSYDARLLAPRIAANGILAFHDALHFPAVTRVVGELLAMGGWAPGGVVQNLAWLKRTEALPPTTS